MIKCPNCARDNADNFNFCLDCGYDLKALREAFSPTTVAPSSPPPPPPRSPSTSSAAGVGAPPARSPSSIDAPGVGAPPARTPSTSGALGVGPPLAGGVDSGPVAPAPTLPASPVGWPPPPASPPVSRPQAPPPTASAPPTLPPSGTQGPRPAPPSPVTIPPTAQSFAPSALPPVAPPPSAPLPSVSAPPSPSVPTTIAPQPVAGLLCPACGYQNASTVKFCGECGKRLDGGSLAPAAGDGPRTMFMHAASSGPVVREPVCRLVTIDQTGREGMTFTLRTGDTVCGRTNGVVLFDDPFVSPTHCRFTFNAGRLVVQDAGSLNGVYLRVRGDRPLADGDYLRVGRQLFRFESLANAAIQIAKADGDDAAVWGSPHPGAFGRLLQILDDGRTGEIRLFSGDRCQLGREHGDIVLPSDGFISGKHCAFLRQGADVVLQDLGSSNGTYVRVRSEAEVSNGDFLLVGNQMLRVEIV